MVNLHNEFIAFSNEISLSSAQKEELRTSRDSVRDHIKKWMRDKKGISVKFYLQGSYAMHTAVKPINEGEYDIDDGVYLTDYYDMQDENLPSCETVHDWIKQAVKDQTSTDPIDKNTCVRVVYKHGYHIDLPIYILRNDAAFLANKKSGWIESDAKSFKDWLHDQLGENRDQGHRLIKYLKRWKDENVVNLKGIELTILVANNATYKSGRDDLSLRCTVASIYETLQQNFICLKPVAPFEDLFEEKAGSKDAILNQLKQLRDALIDATDLATSTEEASEKMAIYFGSSFPTSTNANDKLSLQRTAAPGILKRDGRSG